MKALVLKQLKDVQLCDVPAPKIQHPDDAIIRVTTSGICGSDLHIVHGRDAGVRMGTIMGHEFIGRVEEVGDEVKGIRAGDRVLSPFSINCGRCFYCLRELPARCIHALPFGFVDEQGKGLEGAQADYVRVPLASSTLVVVPDKRADGSGVGDEELLFLGDIFSTAYSTAELSRFEKGDAVAIVGCGPVGLLCIRAAQLLGAGSVLAVDRVDYRLEMAAAMGANATTPEKAGERLAEMTDSRGADAVLEAVGHPSALDLAIQLARPGAVISIAGYHTEPVYPYPIHTAYNKNLTIRIGRCSARKYIPLLLPHVLQNRITLSEIITHVLPLTDGPRGYQLFDQRTDNAVKVVLKP